ncbi:hypothetical protein FO521_04730 [Bacillus pseudomycoides]|uniref:Uncharacterized protein n=1 Tax=Bacillus pseudomycoides TaxID=64104 RepID=A0AAJ2DLR1_9BACI|nr:hypothetical protein [Bacillus pseudomycoides]MDR4325212.1 hypothetical protein [Bacillus pseudomycoides]
MFPPRSHVTFISPIFKDSIPHSPFSIFPRYSCAVRLPPQNAVKAKKLVGESTARKSPIGAG